MMRERTKRLVGPVALVALVGLSWALPQTAAAQETSAEKVWIDDANPDGIDADAPLRFSSLARLAKDLSPSVVNITVTYGDEVFTGTMSASGGATAQGTGFIIHPSGYVLTNNHVVEGAKRVEVRMLDDSEYAADVVGVDPQTDVALMKISADRKFPAVPLGDSDEVSVGEHVLAIGNPLGLNHTVTTGIISALGRRDVGVDSDMYANFIQTDASINPGNSGGPLIGLSGEVVGINTAINRHGQGIGFAIPINMVKTLLPQLTERGYVVRSWLGIRVQALDNRLARSFGQKHPGGALVTEVVESSPAEKGGLKAGDIIVRFDGRPVTASDQLPWLASTAGPNRTVDVELVRDGEQKTLQVTLEKLPDQTPPELPRLETTKRVRSSSGEVGVAVKSLTDTLARQLGAKSTDGVVVTSVGDESPARQAGLRQRDVITEIGKAAVASEDDFAEALDKFTSGDVVRMKIVRGGRVVYIAFER